MTARARKSVGAPASLARPVDRGPACRAEVEAEEAFAEFERSMIQQRVRAGLKVVRDKLARDGKFETRRGVIRTKLGRPGAERRGRAFRFGARSTEHRDRQNRPGARPGRRDRASDQTADAGVVIGGS